MGVRVGVCVMCVCGGEGGGGLKMAIIVLAATIYIASFLGSYWVRLGQCDHTLSACVTTPSPSLCDHTFVIKATRTRLCAAVAQRRLCAQSIPTAELDSLPIINVLFLARFPNNKLTQQGRRTRMQC